MTRTRRHFAGLLALTTLTAVIAAAPAHDVAFWRAVVHEHYAPPSGSDIPALAAELTDLLASPDPELRDDIAYSTLASWIYQQKIVAGDALRSVTAHLLANLTASVGDRDTDTVFRRSFSALVLSVIIARDNADPFFDVEEWHRIEGGALAYLAAEQDVRGYAADKGWMHSAAHTADLLKFLGRSRHLDVAGQTRLLNAIAQKLVAVPVVFTFGEDERLARALLSLTARRDFDEPAFAAWLARNKHATSSPPAVAELRAAQNWKNVLAKLEVLLSNDPQPSESAAAARTALRATLNELF